MRLRLLAAAFLAVAFSCPAYAQGPTISPSIIRGQNDSVAGPTSVTSATTICTLTLTGAQGVGAIITSVGSGNTIVADESVDGTNFTSGTGIFWTTAGVSSTSVTTASQWHLAVGAGDIKVRLRVSTYGSGTVTAQLTGTVVDQTPRAVTGTVTTGSGSVTAAAGDVASGSSDSGNPLKFGVVGKSADPTAVTTGQRVNAYGDLNGKLVISPYALHDNFVNGTVNTTGTSAQTIVAAQGSGIKFYCTTLSLANTGVTPTLATITGSGTLWYTIVPAGGGSNITFPVPIATAANTALQVTFASASTTCYAAAAGYDGP